MTAPALARPGLNGGRIYVHPVTGETVPSVTTVIKVLDKPALPRWAAKAAAEYAAKQWDTLTALDSDEERIALIKGAPWRLSEKAADLGTEVHALIDAYCQGEAIDPDKAATPFMAQFAIFLDQHKPEFTHNEGTVWNRTVGYAGTFDWIARIGSTLILGDTKTGKGVYPEVGLQLAALRNGECLIDPDGVETPMPEVDACAVLHLRPQSHSLLSVDAGAGSWLAFRAARELFDWQAEVAPNVIGAKRPASEAAA